VALKNEFPDMKGFSPRNLKYMRKFASLYPDFEFVQQAVAQIPWGHTVRLMELVKDAKQREWYILRIKEHGWSRDILVHQIESSLFHRQGKGVSNFSRTLPSPQSDLARQTLKDPYLFDFLMLESDAEERRKNRGQAGIRPESTPLTLLTYFHDRQECLENSCAIF
jgi:predicted nuclease of restriction endonuclease-like (RecB) superfamily